MPSERSRTAGHCCCDGLTVNCYYCPQGQCHCSNTKCIPCGIKSPALYTLTYPSGGWTGSCSGFNDLTQVCAVAGNNYCSYGNHIGFGGSSKNAYLVGKFATFSSVFQGFYLHFYFGTGSPVCTARYFCPPNQEYGTFYTSMDCLQTLTFTFDGWYEFPSFNEPPPTCSPFCGASPPSQIILTPYMQKCGCCEEQDIASLPNQLNLIVTGNIACPAKWPIGLTVPLTYTSSCFPSELWGLSGKCWRGNGRGIELALGCRWFFSQTNHDWYQSWVTIASCDADTFGDGGSYCGISTCPIQSCDPIYIEYNVFELCFNPACQCPQSCIGFGKHLQAVVTEP